MKAKYRHEIVLLWSKCGNLKASILHIRRIGDTLHEPISLEVVTYN